MSKRFEESLKEYFDKRPKLEYLNLEIRESSLLKTQGIEHYCFHSEKHHKFHTEDPQLNFISDLSLACLYNLETNFDRSNLFAKVSLKHFYILEERLATLENRFLNLEKSLLQSKILKHIQNLPTKIEFSEQIATIFDHPKKIEEKAITLTQELDRKIDKVEKLCQTLIKHLV